MTHAVTLRHNFETGHRLPHLEGRCVSLHGHSWWVEVTIEAAALLDGTVVEFGAYKQQLRGWIDHNLDHGLMLGADDELLGVLASHGKTYAFGGGADANGDEVFAHDLLWPTVENVAELLSRVATFLLGELPRARGACVTRVDVHETHVNSASWRLAAMP